MFFCEDDLLFVNNCKEFINVKVNSICGFNDFEDYYDCMCILDCFGDFCGDDGCGGFCNVCLVG